MTRTFCPWTHTSDDSYIYQLSLVVATATVSLIFITQADLHVRPRISTNIQNNELWKETLRIRGSTTCSNIGSSTINHHKGQLSLTIVQNNLPAHNWKSMRLHVMARAFGVGVLGLRTERRMSRECWYCCLYVVEFV